MKLRLANLVGFQLVWVAAVFGAAQGLWWPGVFALLLFAGWQLGVNRDWRSDAMLVAIAAVAGFAIDSLWVQLGWMNFASPLPWPQLAPVWIVAMWAGFALTLNHSMALFKEHLWLAALFGLIGGPFAYWIAASAWHAVVIDGWLPYLGLGLAWAVVTPALLVMADRLQPRPLPQLAPQ
jgi:hypothetical protein